MSETETKVKRCPRCDVVFHLNERTRCLYCDCFLVTGERGGHTQTGMVSAMTQMKADRRVINLILKDRGIEGLGRLQRVVSDFFRTRSFHFIYRFSRQEFRIGQDFRRALIQPLNITSFLTIPWVVWNLIDSVVVRVLWNGYCGKCRCKFRKVREKQEHDPRDCAYAREYAMVIDSILTGKICEDERKFRDLARQKEREGLPSAYRELCEERRYFSPLLDIITIWFSISLIILAAVIVAFPRVSVWVQRLE